jgi:hypothetical protein
MSLNFDKVLVISIRHLPAQTVKDIETGVLELPMHAPYEFGYIVWCDEGDGFWREDYPELAHVLDFARKQHGCQWVRFDQELETVEELPKWEW